MGTIANLNLESVDIGNEVSGLRAGYDSGGGFPYTSYIQIERAVMPGGSNNGGFMVFRVAARGTVHLFSVGTVSSTFYYNHIAWTYNNFGTSTGVTTSDTFNDYNNDGAILVCSGPATQMYHGGVCSIYLATDGSRTDFRMPDVRYDLNVRSFWPGYATTTQVAYAWPTQAVLSDGEVLTYSYVNYAENDVEDKKTPGPSTWNAIDSSLGYRVYLSGGTPTSTPNPGTYDPPTYGAGSAALYAINTSQEYADPLALSRTFGPKSLSSVRITAANGGLTLYNNGVEIGNTTISSAPFAVKLTKPNGGSELYSGFTLGSNYNFLLQTYHGPNQNISTPQNAFPVLDFTVTGNSTTAYSISVDNVNFTRERYTGVVTNPDGSTEGFTVQYGLLLSQTDGLHRTTSYSWLGAEGFFYSIAGYASLAKLQSVTRPDGSSIVDSFSHGAVSSSTLNPAGGGPGLTTLVGLPTGCTVANYRICDKPTYLKDPKGNETDYTYDPMHGGILTETLPADARGVRPQKRYTYTQLYPKVLNSSGALANSPPVWRLTRMSECRVATVGNPASCVGTAEEKVTTYSYNSNNLFLTSITTSSGDGSSSFTISYTYDYLGDTTSIKGPRTDVDDTRFTTYDKLRRKVFEIGSDPDGAGPLPRAIMHHVYDADGNEIRTENGTGQATDGSDFVVTQFKRMTYDGVTGLLTKTEEVLP